MLGLLGLMCCPRPECLPLQPLPPRSQPTAYSWPRSPACPQKLYNAHVPGRVVLIYPLPAQPGGSSKGGSEPAEAGAEAQAGAADEAVPRCGLAQVDCASRAVTRLRVSSRMILDHFVDKPPVMQALGG